jgi:hypothetical protein
LVSSAASRAAPKRAPPVPIVRTSQAATTASAHRASFTASGLAADDMNASIGVSSVRATSRPATSAGIAARRQAIQTSAQPIATSAQVVSR